MFSINKLKVIGQCNVTYIMTLLNKTITSDFKVLTYNTTSIAACPTRLCGTSDNDCLDLQNESYTIYKIGDCSFC